MLALAWALTLTTSTLLTTVGPLSSKELGASDSLASFTVGERFERFIMSDMYWFRKFLIDCLSVIYITYLQMQMSVTEKPILFIKLMSRC